ncbi:MAG: hypothetical protein PHY29_03025 [Syntrophales bacterium]|nr:hypothetical protein [Syntrophales bacterium]
MGEAVYQGMPGSRLSRLLTWLKKGQEQESQQSMLNRDRLTDRDRVAETQGAKKRRFVFRITRRF